MKTRLTERDLSRIVKRVINEQDEYVVDQCYNLILQAITKNLDEIVDMAKEELESKGGSFPQGEPPTDDDWNLAMKKYLLKQR